MASTHVDIESAAWTPGVPFYGPAAVYTLNPQGQPHSALVGAETVSLVIYRGEPDEIRSREWVDAGAPPGDGW